MIQYYQPRKFPFSNPLANALVVLVGALAIGASIVLGFIAFVTLGGLILILASIIGIRIWWFNLKMRRRGGTERHRPAPDGSVQVEVIEGEYRVVSTPKQTDPDREP